jgi:hypothetical protein
MYDPGPDLRTLGVDGNGSRRGLSGAAPAVPMSALGHVSARAPVHSDRELRHHEGAIQVFCDRRRWKRVAITLDVKSRTRRGVGRPSLSHAIERLHQGDADCLAAHVKRLRPSGSRARRILDAVRHENARFVSIDPALDRETWVGQGAGTGISAWGRARRAEKTSVVRAKVPLRHATPRDVKRRIVGLRSEG